MAYPPNRPDFPDNPPPVVPGRDMSGTYTPFRHGDVVSAKLLNETIRPYPPAIQVTVWWMGAIALGLAIMLMLELLIGQVVIYRAIHNATTQLRGDVGTVGCPFGAEDCGG
jgi:hypothetical protein